MAAVEHGFTDRSVRKCPESMFLCHGVGGMGILLSNCPESRRRWTPSMYDEPDGLYIREDVIMSVLLRVLDRRHEGLEDSPDAMPPTFDPSAAMGGLGFDASCGTCSELATEVDRIADGRVQVICLHHPAAIEWRSRVVAPNAPLARPAVLCCRATPTPAG